MSTRPPPRRGPDLYDDLTERLLWPRLLRAPALAARPQRLALGLFLVLLVGAIGHIRLPGAEPGSPAFLEAIIGDKLRSAQLILAGVTNLEPEVILSGFAHLATDVTRLLLPSYPVATFLLGIPIVLVIAVLGGAICRSVAVEFAQEIVHPAGFFLRFAAARWITFIGALALPWLVVGAIALVLAVGGWIFYGGVPVLDLIGALLYGIDLLLAIVAALLIAVAAVATPMLLPAAACEGSDAIDAAQRAVAYTIARPLRLAWYLLVAGAIGLLAIGAAYLLAEGGDRFARATLAAWAGPSGTAALTGEFPPAASLDAEGLPRELRGTSAAAARIIGLWSAALGALVLAYAVSYTLAAGTLVYLFIRQVCDGQHYSELWTPGVIDVAPLRASAATPHDASPIPGMEADEDGEG